LVAFPPAGPPVAVPALEPVPVDAVPAVVDIELPDIEPALAGASAGAPLVAVGFAGAGLAGVGVCGDVVCAKADVPAKITVAVVRANVLKRVMNILQLRRHSVPIDLTNVAHA
jgi:hypothetical protein